MKVEQEQPELRRDRKEGAGDPRGPRPTGTVDASTSAAGSLTSDGLEDGGPAPWGSAVPLPLVYLDHSGTISQPEACQKRAGRLCRYHDIIRPWHSSWSATSTTM